MSSPPSTTAEPLLRTLAPALRQLQQNLRTWLDAPHRYPLSTLARATLEGLANDLGRQAVALDVERPLLVILLMGGTGVGKSTLLNALAGGAIAEASFVRPTTRDPVVYHHTSIPPSRLDPALQHCRLAAHDRPALESKVIVDTPDLDSNDLANREKLLQVLPAADIVLYVGSQEKYHDKLGWELFAQQRQRRAFAFVLNKWDRCLHGNGGVRPDLDLLRDLETEGFHEPLLFRTSAQYWVDRLDGTGREGENGLTDGARASALGVVGPPEGEQFPDLIRWLETGLTRLEIEAIKARGVSQLLCQLQQALELASPPQLTDAAARTRATWEGILGEEAAATVEVLLNTLEPYQREIEHHFALEGQRRFRGLMAGYLHVVTRAKYVGSTLRDRIPFLPKPAQAVDTPAAWDLTAFTRACSSVAGDRHLDARRRALPNRLLVEADKQGFPLSLLTEPVEAAAKLNWRQRYAQALAEILQQVERDSTHPVGVRRWVEKGFVLLANWLPPFALLAALFQFLWRYFDVMHKGYSSQVSDVLLPLIVLVIVLVILHLLMVLLLPVRWAAIRGEFERRLFRRVQSELGSVYASIPAEVAEALHLERRQIEQLLGDTREVTTWLGQREQAASIEGLYGH
jgi:energy-coupling factor transporter ATP-binding protein EcfA2